MTGWPFGDLQRGHYRLLLADPPWRFTAYSDKGLKKSPERHYATMNAADIAALPVRDLADPKGCLLILWTTGPHGEIAMDTMRAWGFRYVTQGAWAKQSRTGRAWQIGGGYYFRSACEPYLVGKIGNPGLPNVRDVRNLIVAPVREHSRKPDEMHANLQRMYPGPRCELFARQSRPGWDTWGLERTKFDDAGRDCDAA